MKTWVIPVTWQEEGTVKVVAGSLAEAIELAKGIGGPVVSVDDVDYIPESWDVATEDVEYVRRYYNRGEEDLK